MSNPTYEKNTKPAPVAMPCIPWGAKGCQLSRFTAVAPATTMKRMRTRLQAVMTTLSREDAFAPGRSTSVHAARMTSASGLPWNVTPRPAAMGTSYSHRGTGAPTFSRK